MSILDIFKKKEKFDTPTDELSVPQPSFPTQNSSVSTPPPAPSPETTSQQAPIPPTQDAVAVPPPIANPPRSENFQAEDDVNAVLSSSSTVPLAELESTNQAMPPQQVEQPAKQSSPQSVTQSSPSPNQQVTGSALPDTFPEHATLPPEDFIHEAPSQRSTPTKPVSESDHAQIQAMRSIPKPMPDIVAYPAPTGSGKIFEAIYIKKERYILLLQSLQENTKRLHAQVDDEQRLLQLQESIAQKLEKEESLLHNIFQDVMAMDFLTRR